MGDISNQLIKDSYNNVVQVDPVTGEFLRIGGDFVENPQFLCGVTISNGIRITNNAQNGYVLQSDGVGNGTWTVPPGGVGSSGTAGSSGSVGTSGSSGTSGIDGSSGSAGLDGSSGVNGSSGTAGSSGTMGSSGTNGSSGSSGSNGTSGSSGINGSSGSAGLDGSSGVNGSSGTAGSSGTMGSSGTSSSAGSSGTSGSRGTSGSSGTSGINGSSGSSGSGTVNGITGYIGVFSNSNTIIQTSAPIFQAKNGENSNIGIGTITPDSSAILELYSKTQGFILPSMTKKQMDDIINPKKGLMVYVEDELISGVYVFDSNVWRKLSFIG